MNARETIVKRVLHGDVQLLRDLREHATRLAKDGQYDQAAAAWDVDAQVQFTAQHPEGDPAVGDAVQVRGPDAPLITGTVVDVDAQVCTVTVEHTQETRSGEGVVWPVGFTTLHPWAHIVALLPVSEEPEPSPELTMPFGAVAPEYIDETMKAGGLIKHALRNTAGPGGRVVFKDRSTPTRNSASHARRAQEDR